MDCTEVLNRVGGLQLLPKTELATTKLLDELYDIGILSRYKVLAKLNDFNFELAYTNNRN